MSFLKKENILNYLGLLLFIFAFLLPGYNIIRLIILVLSILILIFNIYYNKKAKLYYKILLSLFIIIITASIDYSLLIIFNKIPILVKETISSNNVTVYNGFSYRVYDCDNNLTIDRGKEKRYVCDNSFLQTISVNDFLEKPKETYNNYQSKFVKITGKISKIIGSNILELQKYTVDPDNTLNGYVVFNDSYIIKTDLGSEVNLINNHIYDEVTIIGRVTSLKKENTYIITLEDSILIPNDIYNKYTIETKTNSSDEIINLTNNYYIYGLDYFNLKYDENNVYELKYALMDKRIALKDFIGVSEDTITENTLYPEDNYNILVCSNKKIIFGSKKLTNKNGFCESAKEVK
jgi:hypothetical protein